MHLKVSLRCNWFSFPVTSQDVDGISRTSLLYNKFIKYKIIVRHIWFLVFISSREAFYIFYIYKQNCFFILYFCYIRAYIVLTQFEQGRNVCNTKLSQQSFTSLLQYSYC